MPNYIDITNQCTFFPPDRSHALQTGNVLVTYNDGDIELKNNIRVNVYPRATFNKPYNISSNITDCNNLFNGCTNFNQPVNIMSCNIMSNAFRDCVNLKQNITIHSYIYWADSMFVNCSGPLNVIYENYGVTTVWNMFSRQGVTRNRINMIFNNGVYTERDTDNILNNIVGSPIEFTKDPRNSCYYNLDQNLYIYGLNTSVSEWELKEIVWEEGPQLQYANCMKLDIGDICLNARFNNGSRDRYIELYYDSIGLIATPSHGTNLNLGIYSPSQTLTISYTNNGITKTATKILNIIENSSWISQSYNISNNITNADELFSNRIFYNGEINFGDGVLSACNMLYNCTNYNRAIYMPRNIINCTGMFNNCISFNSYVEIGRNIKYCESLFRNCIRYDQSTVISANTIECQYMFAGCTNFNQMMTVPNNVTNCYYMFGDCSNFNSRVFIGKNVSNTANMFKSCTSLNNIYIVSYTRFINAFNMFVGCDENMYGNIRIISLGASNFTAMLRGRSSSASALLNIYLNNAMDPTYISETMNSAFYMFDPSINTYSGWEIQTSTSPKWMRHAGYNVNIKFSL